jgi:Fe-S-cluster-containing hydrogenase component 2
MTLGYEKDGILDLKFLKLPSQKQLEKGVAIIECIQNIPCNPCVDSCPTGAISMKDINDLPVMDYDKCIACCKCVGICPGLAIFVVKCKDDKALITLPYEFLPELIVGEKVQALDRAGKIVGVGIVKKVVNKDKTFVVTIEVKKDLLMIVRNIKV